MTGFLNKNFLREDDCAHFVCVKEYRSGNLRLQSSYNSMVEYIVTPTKTKDTFFIDGVITKQVFVCID